jgi:hypothetical protein
MGPDPRLTLVVGWQGEDCAVVSQGQLVNLILSVLVIAVWAVEVPHCLLVPSQQALADLDRGGQHMPQDTLTAAAAAANIVSNVPAVRKHG